MKFVMIWEYKIQDIVPLWGFFFFFTYCIKISSKDDQNLLEGFYSGLKLLSEELLTRDTDNVNQLRQKPVII